HLVAEGDVCDLAIIAGHSNETRIEPGTKAPKKVLRDGCTETGIQSWIQRVKPAVCGLPIILKAYGQVRAGRETLVETEVYGSSIRLQIRNAGENLVGLRRDGMLLGKTAGYCRIELWNAGPAALS